MLWADTESRAGGGSGGGVFVGGKVGMKDRLTKRWAKTVKTKDMDSAYQSED